MIWYELGGVALVLAGFLIRQAMEMWKDARVAEAVHAARVDEQKKADGIRRRRVYTMQKKRPIMSGFPWPEFERRLKSCGGVGARYKNGKWELM